MGIPAVGLKSPVLDTEALNKDSATNQSSHKKETVFLDITACLQGGMMPEFHSGTRLAHVQVKGRYPLS